MRKSKDRKEKKRKRCTTLCSQREKKRKKKKRVYECVVFLFFLSFVCALIFGKSKTHTTTKQ